LLGCSSFALELRTFLLLFLLRLGWGPFEDNKANSLISKERAVEMFLTQGQMKNSQANIDEQKLKWFNKKYSRV